MLTLRNPLGIILDDFSVADTDVLVCLLFIGADRGILRCSENTSVIA